MNSSKPMQVKLHNTLSRQVEVFKPILPGKVKLYTCGLTVYSHPHVGNWVAFNYWDLLHRVLEQSGYRVERVENYTDVGHLVSDQDTGEDKIEKAAKKEGVDAWQIAQRYIEIANSGREQLNMSSGTSFHRATDYIEQQMDMVNILVEKKITYELDDGIYMDTSQVEDYGKLARLDIDGLQSGKRVEDSGKKNPTDFALWKFTPEGQTRDMQWEYPKGSGKMGFPGWHLECSAIIKSTLGKTIDIHTGGIDHIPVHHTNEIAQSESANNEPLSNYWVHCNHMKIGGEKLAKSAGNSHTLEDIVAKGFSPMALKLMIFTSHYRTEGSFSWEILQAAQNKINSWRQVLSSMPVHHGAQSDPESTKRMVEDTYLGLASEALRSDLNTPQAIKILDQAMDALQREMLGRVDITRAAEAVSSFLQQWMGLEVKAETIDLDKSLTFNGKAQTITQLVEARAAAKESGNFLVADEIRDILLDGNIQIKDGPAVTIVSRAS